MISEEKENETVQSPQNVVGRKQRFPSMRVPSVTAIAEVPTVGNAHMTRSVSVGHGMKGSQYHSKNNTRYMLSQPLLTDPAHEIRPLNDGRRRSSGTLSRPDIFYQVIIK